MFRTIEDFKAEWSEEAALTQRVLDGLSDASLQTSVMEGRRTIGQLAWHLAQSVHYMSALGLTLSEPAGEDRAPESAAAIADAYRRVSSSLLDAVLTQWDDGKLLDVQQLFGGEYANGASLRFTIMHQAHHRGQLTILMRLAGLQPPDVYGPTYESWIGQGMEPLL